MKRFIPILLSLAGCVSLAGQTVPTVVTGKMHISGQVYSKGAVHVYAKTDAAVDPGKIDIVDNNIEGATAILKTDTIIFYSDNGSDGLLKNLVDGGVKGTVTDNPVKVVVRKDITYSADSAFTVISLPFDVTDVLGPSGEFAGKDANDTNYDNRYWIYEMDKENWAADANSWINVNGVGAKRVVPFGTNSWKDVSAGGIKKATGYLFWSSEEGNIDFVTTDAADINALFSTDKSASFNVYKAPDANYLAAVRSGWAYIGGLNTTAFSYNAGTVNGYDGTAIYVRDKTSSLSTGSTGRFREFNLKDLEKTIELAPYAPFYVQYGVKNDPSGLTEKTFGFKKSGLSLASAYYRSSQGEADRARLRFEFAPENNPADYDWFYLSFSDNYSESYDASEDAVEWTTTPGSFSVAWSLTSDNNRLSINGLPAENDREIRIGYSAPQAGSYKLSMDAQLSAKINTVVMIDNDMGGQVDMLGDSPYTFNTSAGEHNERFTLYINSSFTSAPAIEGGTVHAFVKDNILTVKNISEGDQIQVLDLSGRTLVSGRASGKEFSTALNQKGVYIVNVKGGKTSKLKVLNK